MSLTYIVLVVAILAGIGALVVYVKMHPVFRVLLIIVGVVVFCFFALRVIESLDNGRSSHLFHRDAPAGNRLILRD